MTSHTKIVSDGLYREAIPQLHITYHVGEDFLDVIDGLRAIDEAVNFLNMECGDRLGHAIALGIDVKDWYRLKNNQIMISQQDYMDNLVWMYNRLLEFDIQGMDTLKSYIEKEYSYFIQKVFIQYMNQNEIRCILEAAGEEYKHYKEISNLFVNQKYQFDLFHYYDSWKLRGDDPSLYEKGYFCNDSEEWKVNKIFPREFRKRFVPEIFLLNYYYQYNANVRKEGNIRMNKRISVFYIDGVEAIQKEMQKKIGRRGIGIETNPSSNFLIGTIQEYHEHPIFRLYNKGLTFDYNELSNCPQLSVSINTDDKGVFSTSLENEYALLAYSLENKLDENGRHIYNRSMVYEWIDEVRKIGNMQSFSQNVQKIERRERS